MKTDWEKYLDRRTKNLGFMSRLGAFRDPTPAEIQRAILIETEAWQQSKGKKTYKTSLEYSISKKEEGFTVSIMPKESAVKAYVKTLMDPENILRMQGIDVERFERPPSFFKKLFNKISSVFAKHTHPNMSYAEKQIFQKKLKEKK